MTYEQATEDLAVIEAPVSAVAEVTAALSKHFPPEGDILITDEVGYVTDEGDVATPADVTVH